MRKRSNLSRTSSHADAMLMNLSKSLIQHKRINTTLAKGKALRRFFEPILTKVKVDTMHSRRIVFSFFQDKEAVKELFKNIAPSILSRPGGYLRIIKTGYRSGDNAATCLIELVDFNKLYDLNDVKTVRTKTRRGTKKIKKNEVDGAEVKSEDGGVI